MPYRFTTNLFTKVTPLTNNMRLFSKYVFTQAQKPAGVFLNQCLDRIVANAFGAKKSQMEIIGQIIRDEYKKADERDSAANSNLHALIKKIPETYSREMKLQFLQERMTQYFAMPVITSHPTRVISNAAIYKLHKITALTMELNKKHTLKKHSLETKIELAIREFIEQPILQTNKMTPQEEAEYTLFIYKNILESFPLFLENLVSKFHEVHGGSRDYIIERVKPAIMHSYRNIYSWTRGDADGNLQVTAKTMSQAVPAQQIAIIQIYLEKISEILESRDLIESQICIDKLKKIHSYWSRCIESIQAGIWFDVKGSQNAVQNSIFRLEGIKKDLPDSLQKKISSLILLVDLAGFFGGMKEYVRQTTKTNYEAIDDLVIILSEYKEDIHSLVINADGSERKYSQLDKSEKIELLKTIGSHPAYFQVLAQNKSRFSETTNKELDRLLFVLKHADIFPNYICSDTNDKINFDEVQLLLRFSSYLDGSLRIGQMSEYPINLLFLCETPEDLNNFLIIMADILDDVALRKRVVDSGFISYVSGPSDLGKTGGIATHISLYKAQMKAESILESYKEKYPELKDVKLRILRGYGGDMKRRIGSAAQQIHSTFQGRDAYDCLGAPGAFLHYLNRVIGYKSESDYRVQELEALKNNNPSAYKLLESIEEMAIHDFQFFINKPSSKKLLIALTNPEIEKSLNTSSRAGSKTSATDLTKVRAIGLVNLYLYTGINWDIFMSVSGWLGIDEKHQALLSDILQSSTVVRDVVYKVLFAIAISDFDRAWLKINHGEVPDDMYIYQLSKAYMESSADEQSLLETLAYIQMSAHSILNQLILFLPSVKQEQLKNYFKEQYNLGKSINVIALNLMEEFGDEFKILAKDTRLLLHAHKDLNRCIDIFEKENTSIAKEDVIFSMRAGRIPAGPDFISNSHSPLKVAENLPHSYSVGNRFK